MTSCEAALDSAGSPEVALEALADCREPFLIGVRHHSPALAAAVPGMLSAAAPEVLLIELPEEFAPWLEYLGDPATVPPVALAGSREHGGVVFLPFAEFSPELAAIRWAREAGVPVVPFDLPLAARDAEERTREVAEEPGAGRAGGGRGRLAAALRARAGGRTEDDLWARLVESGAPGAAPEELRRAALLVGWALRADTGEDAVDPYDLRREANMRGRLAEYAGRRTAAVIGAFHAPALLRAGAGPVVPGAEPVGSIVGPVGSGAGSAEDVPSVITSLVPYSYPLLDERSGYPAGIRDPEWQRGVFRAAGEPGRLDDLLTATAVRICAAVREAGHPSGPADAREVVRVARDLATLRGLPAAGRGELVEAVQTVLTQGQLLGRGRVVAAAMERVLVGDRQGRLAPGTPRSGLGPAVEGLLAELSLPSPTAPARRELRLDALRSELDRRREICLRRVAVCHVPYGEEAGVAGVGDGAALTTRWTVTWTPSTAAMLDVTGVHGVTLEQAAGGVLARRRAAERRDGGPTAAQVLAGLEDAARCALPGLASERLTEVAELLPASGTLPELLSGLDLLSRIGAGHVPGLPAPWEKERIEAAYEELGAAGVRALDGLTGSTDTADARALVDLATRVDGAGGGLRLADALGRLDEDGTPLIRGAAGAARVLLGLREATEFGTRLASRVDAAVTPELRSDLAAFLRGTLLAAGPLLETGEAVDPLLERVESLTDRAFLDRLPALRAGFDVLAPAARSRMLAAVEDRTGHAVGELPDAVAEPGFLARMAAADLAGRTALATAGLDPLGTDATPTSNQTPHDNPGVPDGPAAPDSPAVRNSPAVPNSPVPSSPAVPGSRAVPNSPAVPNSLGPGDRWRLLLGRARQLTGRAGRIARALDELYGSGRGEGVAEPGDDGAGGGSEASFPDVRSWSEELAALFGPGVREEVLAAAADAGRVDALQELDPASARPSVELLRTVLSYAGGMPEQQLARLRPLVARLVKELTDALAHRLRPALAGLAHPRPTRRPGGPLDLARTVRANLTTARRDPATGAVTVLPERPVFRTRARKAADWRLVLVVDVSGSMEASTIWAALTASVVAGVPALSTHFVAFSTEVVDLTDQVDDPLGLLLEVRVGGGTSIARGLRHARSLVTVPSRTLVVLISDFEEGGPVGPLLSEVRALVDSGCHVLGCASLDDAGRPRYSAGVAGQLVAAGMPVAALSPLELARWVGERMGGTQR
ncbi:vWA domain-containing protein [Streptomyces mirabilis]|uniref:vWA domain-containing protein n=1 Tax=Streptomyces mirabilis TaxID=68239 RepID=UPI003820D591